MGMKFEHRRQTGGEILPIVATRVEVEFVRDFAGSENAVEQLSAVLEAVVVFRAAVKVNLQSGQMRCTREIERIITLPEERIRRRAKRTKQAQQDGLLRIGEANVRKFGEKSGTVSRDRGEKFGMAEAEMERTISAHGNSADAARLASRDDAVVSVNEWNELAHEEVFVSSMAVAGIDVEAGASVRRNDEKFADFPLLPEIFDEIPAARGDKELFVAAEAMKEVKNRITPGFRGIVAGWKDSAIANVALEDLAVCGATLDASKIGVSSRRKSEKCSKEGESKYAASCMARVLAEHKRQSNYLKS